MGAVEITLFSILGLCLIVGGAYLWATAYHITGVSGLVFWDSFQGLVGFLCVFGGLIFISTAVTWLFKKNPEQKGVKE